MAAVGGWRKAKAFWAKYRSTFLLTFLAAFAISRLDVLGLYDSLVPLSDRIALRVAAPAHDPEGRKRITVILVDKQFMDRMGGGAKGWPLAAVTIGNLLEPIAEAGAKAIFVDIVFTDMPRPVFPGKQPDGDKGIAALGDSIRTISESVPVFVTDTLNIVPARDAHCAGDWADVDTLADNGTLSARFRSTAFAPGANSGSALPAGLEVVAANWLDEGSQYPLGILVASHAGACNDTILGMPSLMAHPDKDAQGGYLVSPAAALYALFCRDPNNSCGGVTRLDAARRPAGYRLYALGDDMQERMLVRWGSRQSRQMRDDFAGAGGADRCIAQNTSSLPFETVVQSVHAILPFLDRLFGSPDRTCPYIDTLSADVVLEPELYFPNEKPAAVLSRYLKDRIVMIGADLPYVQDRAVSPIAGDVPGVYLHAMALDNLIGYGDGYQREPAGLSWWAEGIAEALVVAILAIALPLFATLLLRQNWMTGLIGTSHARRLAVFFATLALLLLLAVVLALCVTVLMWRVLGFNPMFVALAVMIPLIEELRHEFLSLPREHG